MSNLCFYTPVLKKTDRIIVLPAVGGQINITPKPTKRSVNIDTWTYAFIVFMAVYCQVHKEQYPDMLKYLHTIRLGAKQYYSNGWLSYDEEFRLNKFMCSNMSWAVVDQELWLLFMCRPKPELPNNDGGTCFESNYKGFCSKPACNFAHKCIRCGGRHAMKLCNNKSVSSGNQSSTLRSANSSGSIATQLRFSTIPLLQQH